MSVLKFKDPESGRWIEITGLKGDKGDKGDQPVKGVDYWTQEDIQEMIAHLNSLLDSKLEEVENGTY